MDRTRGRRPPTFKSQTSNIAPKAAEEDFKPAVEWTEDQSNRILLIHLPGFKREEIRVQLDNAGKLLIKGIKQVRDKYIHVDLSFDVPHDTIGEKISGRFEFEHLTLIMPKKAVKEQEATEKEKAVSEGKGKESIQNAKTDEDKKHEPAQEKPAATEALQDEPKINDDSKQETIQNLNSLERGEEKKDEPVEKLEGIEEEKKKEDPLQAMLKAVEGVKEEKNIQKMKSKIKQICADKPKEIMEKISTWKDAEDGYGSLDGILEKMNRNRKLIAIAVVAFSIGFYVSHKLRTSGR